MKRLLCALALGASLVGCGSGDDDSAPAGAPLDCAWLAGENCWKTLVAEAADCVPPATELGALSGDGSACTYASGASIDFSLHVVLPLDATTSPPWDFAQSLNDEQCVRFDSKTQDAFTLSVKGMTFVEKSTGFGLQVTCPDGKQYAAENGLDLLNCPDYLSNAPGHSWSSTDTSVIFALLTGHGDTLTVFDCGS